MFNNNVSRVVMVIAVMMVLSLSVLPFSALANGPRVFLKELEATDGTKKVDVVIEDVTDLYGMEFEIKYDPSVLAVKDTVAENDGVQVGTGSFLPADKGFVVANEVNAANGTIILAVTLLNPAPAVSGSGALAHLTFETLNDTATSIEISKLNLVSGNMTEIAVQSEDLQLGGNAGSDSNSGSFMWLVIAGGAGLVILMVLAGGFMMMGQSKSKQTPNKTKTRQATKQSNVSV